jgi:probable F420-dependent oxidoreductase
MECALQIGWTDITRLRDQAQAAEGLGYRTIYFPDHLVAEGPERQVMGVPSYDPLMQASVVATATSCVRIGHLVLCNLFRHPSVTARSLATLDQLSGGRMVAGLGSGWTETEFRMTGIEFPDIGPRLRMLDEALTCVRGLWGDAPFSFAGEFYRFTDASLLPKPVQARPPILLGGSGKGLLRIAARHADVLNIVSETGRPGYIKLTQALKLTDATFRDKVRFVRDEAARAGRDPKSIRLSSMLFTVQLTDSRAATDVAAEGLGGMFGVPPAAILGSPLFLVGTPDDCIVELRRRQQEWDLAEIVLAGPTAADLAERFGREILPHV